MESERAERISRAFCEVLEKQAFLFAEPPDGAELPAPAGPCVLARMGFSGHWGGSFSLAVPREMCPEIAANVLGLEADDPAAAERDIDALKELLNVACGRALTALAGEQPVFDLSVPQVSELPPEAWKALRASADCLTFVVDDRPVLVALECGK